MLFRGMLLLRLHEQAGPARCRAVGHRPTRLMHVPIKRDTTHADVPRESDGLRGSRVVAYQRVVEHEGNRFGHLVWVPDERERGRTLSDATGRWFAFVVGGSHGDCHKDTSPETGE
jgi:hypothetical protein